MSGWYERAHYLDDSLRMPHWDPVGRAAQDSRGQGPGPHHESNTHLEALTGLVSSGSYFLSSGFISAQIGLFFSISIEYNFPVPILAFVGLYVSLVFLFELFESSK